MDKKRRLPDGGQAAEEVKVQPWGGVNQRGIGGGTLRAVGA